MIPFLVKKIIPPKGFTEQGTTKYLLMVSLSFYSSNNVKILQKYHVKNGKKGSRPVGFSKISLEFFEMG